MMMRAALILGGLGVLTAMELGTPSRSEKSAVAPPPAQAVAGAGAADTLTKADRLEIFRMPSQAPAAAAVLPASLVEQVAAADPLGAGPQQTQQGADGRVRAARAAVALPRPRPGHADSRRSEPKPSETKRTEPKRAEPKQAESKHAETRTAARPDRTRPIAETRSCQANAFAGLLKALSLPSGCDT
jgi:hypothetical protein